MKWQEKQDRKRARSHFHYLLTPVVLFSIGPQAASSHDDIQRPCCHTQLSEITVVLIASVS
jgi:hypothetical protein